MSTQLPTLLLSTAACALLVAVWTQTPGTAGAARNTRWWSLHRPSYQAQDLSHGEILSMFSRRQQQVFSPPGCTFDPGLLRAVLHGVHNALRECERQMAAERWNCSRFAAHYAQQNIFGRLLTKGYPETAFVQAIVSAGITAAVATECRRSISCCPCRRSPRVADNAVKEPGGVVMPDCDHNVKFGRSITKGLLDKADKGRDTLFLAMLHNYNSGRRAVARTMKRNCLCHGTSGSCSYQTCWKKVANFKDIGEVLKAKYRRAVLVTRGAPVKMYVEHPSKSRRRRRLNIVKVTSSSRRLLPRRSDLVYSERPPQNFYCERRQALGILGTRNRICDAHNASCDHICCGRPYTIEHYRFVNEKCQCKFVWCCDVKCQTCVETRLRKVCD